MRLGSFERLTALGFSALAFVVIILAGVWAFITTNSLLPLLIGSWFALCLVPILIAGYRGELNIFEPIIFHCAFGLMIGAALLERSYFSNREFRHEIISHSFETGMTIVSAVLVAMLAATLVGYYLLGPRVPSITDSLSIHSHLPDLLAISGSVYRKISIFYFIIGFGSLIGVLLFVFPEPNPFYMFQTNTPRSEVFSGSNIFVMGARSLYIGYLLWICGALAERRAPNPIEILGVVPIVGLFLLLGGRGRALGVLILVFIVLYLVFVEELIDLHRGILARLSGSIPPAVVLLGLPLISIGIAIGVVLLRSLRLGQNFSEALLGVDSLSIASAGVHNDQFDNFLALTEIVPEQIGYQFGAFYARVPLNFIPRAIWPDKPVLTPGGVLRRELLPDAAGGRHPGTMGDYYINFGYPGILLISLIYGALLRLLYRLIDRNPVSPLSILFFALFLSGIGNSGLTNNALQALMSDLIILTPALTILLLIAYRNSNSDILNQQEMGPLGVEK
ncbi:O-antigen polymerase [Natronorarus salvus]|uniref:O-antigen polymerase n=1 Tax=Natronorarus salvus TaxID=3117733 RepID=UPI002F2685AE